MLRASAADQRVGVATDTLVNMQPTGVGSSAYQNTSASLQMLHFVEEEQGETNRFGSIHMEPQKGCRKSSPPAERGMIAHVLCKWKDNLCMHAQIDKSLRNLSLTSLEYFMLAWIAGAYRPSESHEFKRVEFK